MDKFKLFYPNDIKAAAFDAIKAARIDRSDEDAEARDIVAGGVVRMANTLLAQFEEATPDGS